MTAIVLASFVALVVSAAAGRREIWEAIRHNVNVYSAISLIAILAFFLLFSIFFVSPVMQLYFDESIYQGIALNILHNGNALWCQYGTAYLTSCPYSVVYHDPVGWTFFIAVAFWIFGVSTATAYNLQLLVGFLSIIGVFLLATALFNRKEVPVLAALFMALNPQLFIWSRTQAVADLPFMMLTVFAFFFFVVYIKRKRFATATMAVFSLILPVYTRIEGFLLVPVIVMLYFAMGDSSMARNVRAKWRRLRNGDIGIRYLILIAVIAVLLIPQFLYIVSQAETGNYGQSSGQGLLSLANLNSNFNPNLEFLLGEINHIYNYPEVWPLGITVAAIIGAALFMFERKYKGRFSVLLLLGIWAVAYYVFYDFFYAGSVLYGVDVRFMLEILPPLAILAGLGVFELSRGIAIALRMAFGAKSRYVLLLFIFMIAGALAAYPFVTLIPNITLKPQQMPQQSVILRAVNFIYDNYTKVPTGCLVFSFTPDLWYTLDRSSAQIGYLGSSNASFESFESQFSCYVLDYGYWCQVSPYQNTTCSTDLHNYKIQPIATTNNSTGVSLGLYRILNYTT